MRTFLLILLLTITHICNGQNYKCLQPGVKRYFVNDAGYVRGMRIDSTITAGSSTIYYPFHTPRGSYLSVWTLDSSGGSWLGKQVVEDTMGTFLFDNIWNDTTIINTQAHTGDTWVFYNDTASRYYTATVLSEDTMTVLSAVDSIKKIQIKAFSPSGADTLDAVNNFQIILSKNHGFVKIFDLYTFPYHKPNMLYRTGIDYYLDFWSGFKSKKSIFSLIQFVNPTFEQLYDWNVGDVFANHVFNGFSDGSFPTRYYCDSITNKNIVSGGTLFSFQGWVAEEHLHPSDWHYGYYPCYDTMSVSGSFMVSSSLLIDTNLMPEEKQNHFSLFYLPKDTSFCLNTTLYRLWETDLNEMYGYEASFETYGLVVEYKPGIGLTYYHWDILAGSPQMITDTTLLYYRKDGKECGRIPPFRIYDPTSVTDVHKQKFSLLPNPVTTALTITASVNISEVTITNMLGEVVYKNEPAAKEIHINTEHFPPGMYFARINGVEVRKFIKQ